jgi:hypothetical protein
MNSELRLPDKSAFFYPQISEMNADLFLIGDNPRHPPYIGRDARLARPAEVPLPNPVASARLRQARFAEASEATLPVFRLLYFLRALCVLCGKKICEICVHLWQKLWQKNLRNLRVSPCFCLLSSGL